MNILILTYQGDIAGSTNSISYLARGLSEKGHNVYVGCRRESLLYSLLENTNVNLVEMTFKSKLDFQNIRHINEVVKKYNIDIINAQSSKDRYTAIFSKMFYKFKSKIVHTRRQTPKSSGFFIQNWLYNTFTDMFVAVSDEVKEELIKGGLAKDKVKVIYNGTPNYKYQNVDKNQREILKEKYNIKENEFVIGSISRKKEQDQIIEALALLPSNCRIIFIGLNADEFESYRPIIEKHKLQDRVLSIGMINGKETLDHYQILDVDVLASTMEGLSQSLLEAMYLGIPVVATRAAGNISLIKDKENGLFFENKDPEGLARAIRSIMESDELRTRLILEGEKTAKVDFSIEKVIENYEKKFSELLMKNRNNN